MADLNFPTNPNVGDTYSIGSRTWVWNGTAWQLQSGVISTNPFTVVSAQITTSTNSTGTSSGALIVNGGAGFNGDIYAKNMFSNGAEVITTATLDVFGGMVQSVTGGTDISVNTTTGHVTVNNISTLESVTDRGATTTNAIYISNSTESSSTTSGALVVVGGVGIGGDLYIGGTFYAGGQAVLTTASFFSAISEGTDISITEGTSSTVVISNTSTLQSVTARGSTTTQAINITNLTSSTSTNTGALTVAGGVGVGKDLYVGGSVTTEKFVSDPSPSIVNLTPVILDSFNTSEYRSAKYFISISNTTTNQFQTSEIWLVHNDTSAHIEQTSVFSDNAYLVTFSTNVNAGEVSLIGVGIDENIKVKMQNTYITV